MTTSEPEAIVAHAALPEPLGGLVLETVRRARLWKGERADVAGELVAQFRDGLDRGATPADLAAAFGPVAPAAKLIRRAKRRARPLAWRLTREAARVAAAGTALLLVLYAILAIRFFTGSPVFSRDYLAELNQSALAVPSAERAWPLYRSALLSIGALPDDLDLSARPGSEAWAAAADFVAAHAGALAKAREAAARPGLGFVVGYGIAEEDSDLWPEQPVAEPAGLDDRGLMFVLLPQLHELRVMGRMLAVEAMAAADRGDAATSAADVEAMLGIAEHTAETPALIGDLVVMGQITVAARTMGAILGRRPDLLSEAQLRNLAHRFSSLRGGGRLAVRFDSEVIFFQDFLQRLYTDDGQGDGRITATGLRAMRAMTGSGDATPAGPLAPAYCALQAGRRDMAAEYERLMAMVEAERAKPLWQQDLSLLDREVEAMNGSLLQRARYLPILLLMPALDKASRKGELATMERDAALVAIALEQCRRRAGAYPAALDALVPDFLPAVPPDRFDGRPLRYRLGEDRSPLLYSVGPDREDAGGDAARDNVFWPLAQPSSALRGPPR